MKHFKIVLTTIILMFFHLNISAQTNRDVIGQWESKDSNEHLKYLIFEDNAKLYAIVYYINDGEKIYSYEKELNKFSNYEKQEISQTDLEQLENLIVLYDFTKNGSKWNGKLVYDDNGSTTDAYLKLLDSNKIEIGVNTTYYSNRVIWKRIQ